jgi:STIP1 family protein 1
MAYELCSKSVHQTSSAFAISAFVLKCKKAKWDLRQRERLIRRKELLGELEEKLIQDRNREYNNIQERLERNELGSVAFTEERDAAELNHTKRINELRNAFAISDPEHLDKRVSVDKSQNTMVI